MSEVLDRVAAYWKRQDTGPALIQATPEEIAAWQEHHGVRLPADLREYLLRLNGTEGGEKLEFGNDMISFLPLAAMKPEPEWSAQSTRCDMFVFADHCISCFWWCVRLSSVETETTEVHFGGAGSAAENRLVATSLAEFFELYMSDPTLKSFM